MWNWQVVSDQYSAADCFSLRVLPVRVGVMLSLQDVDILPSFRAVPHVPWSALAHLVVAVADICL